MAANLWHLALLLMAAAQLAAACSPAQRSACAKAPGNLTRIQIPQLVIVTWDDAVTSQSYGIAQSIMGGLRQRNGCGVPSTFFVTTEDTIPAAVQALYFSNNEIATHTRTHPRYPSAEEIVGARDWLANQTGIPRSKINGYRAPFLLSNAVARRALTEAGFLYDSSIPDTAPSSVSPNVRSRTWPYRMDAGIAQAPCQTGQCRASERYPLWEVPLWAVADARQQPIATMDPTGDAFAIYKRELEWRMSGNRAPLGLFFHTGLQSSPDRVAQLRRFIKHATSTKDVWFVTNQQLLGWMQNPVPASRVAAQLKCVRPTDIVGPACSTFVSDCVFGSWDGKRCRCTCLGEGAGGYCRNRQTGACTELC